ncbi:hypothetical protein Tco_0182753, partial [Tanacetum coccineum]
MQEEDKTTLPPAGYTLTNAEKDTFCETLHNIRVPQIAGTGMLSTLDEGTRKSQPLLKAFLLSEDELAQESDDEEVFAARKDMDEDTQVDEEVHSPPPNTKKPESSPIQDTDKSTSDSNPELKKYDNILPLTKRKLVKYLRKVARVVFNKITEEQWAQH